MKVLLWPQPSMRNYQTGLWHLEMDPQINKNRAWANHTAQWEWGWLLPKWEERSEESGKGVPDFVRQLPMSWAENVLTARYHFPFDEVCDWVKYFKPDAMILEVPEHAKAMRMVQQWTGIDFPIFSYVNYATHFDYTATDETIDTWGRQLEGAMVSDALVFNTHGLREGWLARVHDDGFLDKFQTETQIWKAVYSPAEMDRAIPWPDPDPPAINFISRLSDPRKNRHLEFFEATNQLVSEGYDIQLWVGNPNRSMDPCTVRGLAKRVTKIGYDSREAYLNSMRSSAVVPCLWAQDQIYSIGYCDALASGAMVIAARDRDEVGGIPVPSEACADDIYVALKVALGAWADDFSKKEIQHRQREWLMHERSCEVNMGEIVRAVEAWT